MSEPIWIGHDDDPREDEEQDMSGLEQLRPGDIGFGPIGGLAGVGIRLGQKIVDATTPEESKYQHVLVVTEAAEIERGLAEVGPGWITAPPRIVQAMPRGAEEVEIGAEHWTPAYLYIRPHYRTAELGYEALSLQVAHAARKYVGTPYSFLDYAAIAGLHLGIKDGCVRRRVTSSKHMICSQLADQSMSDAGWHVFDDGRLPQDVTPAALYRQMRRMPGQYIVGGTNVWLPNKVDN